MDYDTLVEGGVTGLKRIAEAFRSSGISVSGIYLIKLTSDDSFEDWTIRLIVDGKTPDLKRKMIAELVKLRRDDALPTMASSVRFDIVSSSNLEASRIIEYTNRLGGPPVTIRDAMWKGLFIEFALVASVPQSSVAVA